MRTSKTVPCFAVVGSKHGHRCSDVELYAFTEASAKLAENLLKEQGYLKTTRRRCRLPARVAFFHAKL